MLALQLLHSSRSSHQTENDSYFLSLPPNTTCNVISLCPGPKLSSVCSNGFSWAHLACEAAVFKRVSFGRAAFLSPCPCCVCAAQTHIHVFISLLLPGDTLTLGHLSLLFVDITKLSMLHGDALTFTPSYPILQNPPLVFGSFKFLLISY